VAEMERSNMLRTPTPRNRVSKAKGSYTGRLYGLQKAIMKFWQNTKRWLKSQEMESLRRAANWQLQFRYRLKDTKATNKCKLKWIVLRTTDQFN
jgi:hypothetical protein